MSFSYKPYGPFVRAIEKLSNEAFPLCLKQWIEIGNIDRPDSSCICGRKECRNIYEFEHVHTGKTIIVGSTCINHFVYQKNISNTSHGYLLDGFVVEDDEEEEEEDEEEPTYIVEAILEHRVFNGVNQWYVKWEGYSYQDCTWEPLANLENNSVFQAFCMNEYLKDKNDNQPSKKRRNDDNEESERKRRRMIEDCVQFW